MGNETPISGTNQNIDHSNSMIDGQCARSNPRTAVQSDDILIDTGYPLDIILQQVLNHGLLAVNAPAGSLMLVALKQGILQVKARLGPPRPRRVEPVYEVSGRSIASQVVQQRRSYICADVDQDPNFVPARSGPSFLSLLSVPIIHAGEVIAVINADSPEKGYFKQWHQEQLERVARTVAGSIAERISILEAIAAVGIELMRLPRDVSVEQVLLKVARAAEKSLGADVVTLYQYDQATGQFLVEGTGPTVAGELSDPTPMRRRIYDGDVPHIVVQKRASGYYTAVRSEDFLTCLVDRPGELARPRFYEREKIQSMAALLLPARAAEKPDEEIVGVMFANYRTKHNFNIDERTALETFADYASVAILNARHEEQTRAEKTREAQLAMVQSISSNFAHRLSDLAGTSRVATKLLRRKLPSHDRESRRLLQRIDDEAEVLSDMAKRITAPFRLADVKEAAVDVVEIVERELAGLDRIAVNRHYAPSNLPLVRSIGFQLEQVIHDLLRNSVEAMRSVPQKQLTVKIQPNATNDRLTIEIKDNGTGIPVEIVDKLFNPFVTSKENNLGIGLWWSRNFLRSTNGDLRLGGTQLGIGTLFVIDLQIDHSKKPPHRPDRNKLHKDLLIVEDSPRWRDTFVTIFTGYSWQVAKNYQEAADALTSTEFKIAILDIHLGTGHERDGLKLLSDIEQGGYGTAVIIASNYPEYEDDRVRNSSLFLGFVRKDDDKFVDKISRFVRKGIGSSKKAPEKKWQIRNTGRCFISYAREDQQFVMQLYKDLEANQVHCWIDEELTTGAEFRQEIHDAIGRCDKFIVVLSKASLNSRYVKEEVEAALSKEETKSVIIPVRLDEAVMGTNKAWAKTIREMKVITDFSNWKKPKSYHESLQKLLESFQVKKARAVTAP